MELLEKTISERGEVLPGNIVKVGSFLNQKIDVSLMKEMAKDVFNHFKDKKVTKVLTVEASGIAFASFVAYEFGCEMVFAKKGKTLNVSGDCYSADCYSYTHERMEHLIVPTDYIVKEDCVLVADDFLARGTSLRSLFSIVEQAGAKLVGATCPIEKGFQGGGDGIRAEGIDVYSLAIVESIDGGKITFRK